MTYEQALHYLDSFQRFGIRLGLERITYLLQALGNPHLQFPSILIGGTNGKGSTAAFLSSILRAGGYKVGLYTSPHLIDFRERIQINGHPIPEDKAVELLNEMRSIIDQRQGQTSAISPQSSVLSPQPSATGHQTLDIRPQTSDIDHPTYFEGATAIAFTYFSREGVDLAVVEVGLGGRFDATNVLYPLASAITNVSLEHQDYLGGALPKIAFEKAGIIREKGSLVTAVEDPAAWEVVARVASELGAQVYKAGRDFAWKRESFGLDGQTFNFFGELGEHHDLKIRLLGEHQVANAAVAVALSEVLRRQGVKLDSETISSGLSRAEWPGRLQVLRHRPLVLLDGAHNPAGAKCLRAFLEEILGGCRLLLVFGVLGDKDWKGMLAELGPLAYQVVLTRPDTPRAVEPEKLYLIAQRHCPRVVIQERVPEALAYALSQATPEDV
ncbi:MAG: bifunctional folylpolyglutamate synthase/dihydrofolate synthase, partial [candidate division NC10 bacterium]|nr:bifunctional folylpolyglutamate synthase/dihydrofolate synthase [candidate division NC10 bacterium]